MELSPKTCLCTYWNFQCIIFEISDSVFLVKNKKRITSHPSSRTYFYKVGTLTKPAAYKGEDLRAYKIFLSFNYYMGTFGIRDDIMDPTFYRLMYSTF